jgi:hypothetical protein
VKTAVDSFSKCFDNVFITTKSESVFWDHFSLLRAQLNCISDLPAQLGQSDQSRKTSTS